MAPVERFNAVFNLVTAADSVDKSAISPEGQEQEALLKAAQEEFDKVCPGAVQLRISGPYIPGETNVSAKFDRSAVKDPATAKNLAEVARLIEAKLTADKVASHFEASLVVEMGEICSQAQNLALQLDPRSSAAKVKKYLGTGKLPETDALKALAPKNKPKH